MPEEQVTAGKQAEAQAVTREEEVSLWRFGS